MAIRKNGMANWSIWRIRCSRCSLS